MNSTTAAGSRPGAEGDGATGPGAPDINAETYPFEVVQGLLDEAAYFNLFSIPDVGRRDTAITAPGRPSIITGLHVREILCRFTVQLAAPRARRALTAANWIGDPVARFEHRWMIIPDDFHARPDRVVPMTLLDETRPQRFAMVDARCLFGANDWFRGFGTGATYPVTRGGRRELLVSAVGTILEGFGRFKGLEGTYTYCGSLTADVGFRGNLLLRVMDGAGVLRAQSPEPRHSPGTALERGETYVIFRGEKSGRSDRTGYRYGPGGRIIGLSVAQRLRALALDVATDASSRLGSVFEPGPVIGRMTAEIDFDLLNPGGPGTAFAPAPFQSLNRYTFTDRDGEALGVLTADGNEGRTFHLRFPDAPGQAALRFGGFGPIVDATGALAGASGLMMDNSVVGLAPHALATSYVLRLDDPEGRFRDADDA